MGTKKNPSVGQVLLGLLPMGLKIGWQRWRERQERKAAEKNEQRRKKLEAEKAAHVVVISGKTK